MHQPFGRFLLSFHLSHCSLIRWNDFNLTSHSQITSYGPADSSSISSFVPLWAGLLETDDSTISLQKSVLDSLEGTYLIQEAGIATTSISSGQQWDSPNAWPPLVLLIVEGLRVLTISDAHKLAVSCFILFLVSLLPLPTSGFHCRQLAP